MTTAGYIFGTNFTIQHEQVLHRNLNGGTKIL